MRNFVYWCGYVGTGVKRYRTSAQICSDRFL